MSYDAATALDIFKNDLGATHDVRDSYYGQIIAEAAASLEGRGVHLDADNVSDNVFLGHFAHARYLSRTEGGELPLWIAQEIRNRVTKGRSETA